MTTHTHHEQPHHDTNQQQESATEQRPCCASHQLNQAGDIDGVSSQQQATPLADQAALEALKHEILDTIDDRRTARAPLPWGSVTVSVILGLLAIVSVAQATQSATLYAKLRSGDFKATGSASSGVDAGASTPSSLPNQVGGC